MLFVGSADRGFFAEEIATKKEIPFSYVDSNPSIISQTNSILEASNGKQNYTIFDVEQYIDDAEIIADEVVKICNANNSKPIVFASGYKANSHAIVEFSKRGINYFILGSVLSEMKDQLEKCMNGYYDANGIEVVEDIKQAVAEEESNTSYNCTSIAVVGACERIGTTTFAIQLIRYIQLKGKTACYIQMNNSSYLEKVSEWYDCTRDDEICCVTYENIDHYYKPENIREIMKKGYDYYIYDYGVYFNNDFNRVSFLEKDKGMFVVGSDCSELTHTLNVIRSAFYDDVDYIFNFTADSEKQDVLELMEDKKERSYFTGYIPNKYAYVPNDIYERLLPIDGEIVMDGKAKKKSFFGRRKR